VSDPCLTKACFFDREGMQLERGTLYFWRTGLNMKGIWSQRNCIDKDLPLHERLGHREPR
jgi:hypothetical protein